MNSKDYVFIENEELFLNISPYTALNQRLVLNNNINTNSKYRHFLQQNALTIKESNFKVPTYDLGKNIPYTFSCSGDTSQPNGYETSVPKQKYLSEQFIISNQTRPMFDSFIIELR